VSPASEKITRDDLENAFRGIVDDGHETVVETGAKAAGAAGALAFLALAVTYVVGRRRGSKAKAVVEVRRI
jgi:hypothetical protein